MQPQEIAEVANPQVPISWENIKEFFYENPACSLMPFTIVATIYFASQWRLHKSEFEAIKTQALEDEDDVSQAELSTAKLNVRLAASLTCLSGLATAGSIAYAFS